MLRLLLPAAFAALTTLGAFAQPTPALILDPVPRIVVRDARIPVRLEAVDIRTDVVGHAAQTRVELIIRNPNDRVLEGELQFPLREGQVVSGFALDINGELRPAVTVEKAKGQQVFEEVIRARVDPALLEVTQGNNYKLRVYPLPAQGVRRVVLEIAQTLASSPRGAASRLDLPLKFAEAVGRLDVDVRVADVPAAGVVASLSGLPADAISRSQQSGFTQLTLHRMNFAGPAALEVAIAARTEPQLATQRIGDQTYFYAELPLAPRTAPRTAPRRIALLWDASGSGARRDHGREFALLDAYFRALRNTEVMLRVGRDVAEAPQRFIVKDGRWDELRQALSGVAYDGATNLAALVASEGCELALLFSDGLANWGAASVPASAVPLYAISAAASLDPARLRGMAERSGGEWLDLASTSSADAAKALQTRKARLVRAYSNAARQIVVASPYASQGHLAIAGILSEPKAMLTLELELPDGRIERQQLAVGARGTAGASFVAQQWASLRVAELEVDHDANRGEIRRIGKAFAIVTRETSLIVLDAVADYARYEIEPPATLRADYERLLAQQSQRNRIARANHLDRVAARFAQQVAWWERAFPKNDMPVKADPQIAVSSVAGALGRSDNERRQLAQPLPATAAPPAPAQMRLAAPAMAEKAADALVDSRDAPRRKEAKPADEAGAPATIRLTPWAPDSAYARRLREASTDTVYQRYLDERPSFVNSTAFFLDAADVLVAKGQPELALRVLSNLAEMELENRHILRVLGYRLLQARQPALAVPLFRTVLRLSPDEPQSFRDLGLALAEADQWQDAVDQLWQVVSRPWNARFPDIDLTALAELNVVAERAAKTGKPVRTQDFDARLMRNLPLDLRITLAWDSDNTDIDLWVIDPNGEKAYYGHPLSYQGGRMSQDVTGGYGPEEFALRVAKPGKYTVQAQFYGHRQQVLASATTLMMRLTTGFGRPDQKDELVTLRLAGQSEMVTVGTFEVGR